MASTLGELNPYRYRGYRFDSETGLYYLQSRYYDAAVGRFVNADDFAVPLIMDSDQFGLSLFTYCLNNPVSFTDTHGYINQQAIEEGLEYMRKVLEYLARPENKDAYKTIYGIRIPDFVSQFFVGEIKYVTYLALTRQLKGMLEIARSSGKTFILIVRKGAKLSRPLLNAIKSYGGKVIQIGSNDLFASFSLLPWWIIEKLARYDPRTGRYRDEVYHQ